MIHKLAQQKSVFYVLILSMMFSLFVPMTARAGVLGSVLNFVSPYAKILGNIGGAIAGASLGSAFCPPLGTIGGAIIGYVVGGVIGSYAAGGLSNVATLAGSAAGYVALASSGPVGMIAGIFIGGLLGKVAYRLLKKVDNSVTGGVVFAPTVKEGKGDSATIGNTAEVKLSDDIPASNSTAKVRAKAVGDLNESEMTVQEATQRYEAAYKNYITATRDTANNQNVNRAYKEYLDAYNTYKKVVANKKAK